MLLFIAQAFEFLNDVHHCFIIAKYFNGLKCWCFVSDGLCLDRRQLYWMKVWCKRSRYSVSVNTHASPRHTLRCLFMSLFMLVCEVTNLADLSKHSRFGTCDVDWQFLCWLALICLVFFKKKKKSKGFWSLLGWFLEDLSRN